MKQIKGLVCKDLAASKTDRQTVKKTFQRWIDESSKTFEYPLKPNSQRIWAFLYSHWKKSWVLPFSVREELSGLVLITGQALRRRAWYWWLVYWGILQNITCSHVSTLYLHNCAHKVITVASLVFPFWHFLGLNCWCVVLGAFDIWATLIRLLWSSIQSH